jgi:hypothetical protein
MPSPQYTSNSYSIKGRRAFGNENLNFSFNAADSSLIVPNLAGTQTSSVAQTDAYPVGGQECIFAAISITGTPGGTLPTLVMNIQTSTTFGGTFTTIASTSAINSAGITYLFAPVVATNPPATNWYKITLTIGGTTPSFAVAGVGTKTFDINRNQF